MVGLVSLVSASLYAGVHYWSTPALPIFQGACERLRSSGLTVLPQDWFCQSNEAHARLLYAIAAVLIGIGLAIPPLVLAASGYRLWACLPLMLSPRLADTYGGWWGPTFWPNHGIAAAIIALVLLSAPAAAVLWAHRHRRTRRLTIRRGPAVIAAIVVAGAGLGILALRHSAFAGADAFEPATRSVLGTVAPFAVFAALLGTDRRWWPWILAPVALLMSGGPYQALIDTAWHGRFWLQFGEVLPLVIVGLVCSSWQPLAYLLARERGRDEPRARVRPFRQAALNLSAGLLVIAAMMMFAADQSGLSLPMYLEPRQAAQDLRAKLDLQDAMASMNAYHERHGTYVGFDATVGTAAEGSLSWLDGWPPSSSDDPPVPVLTMAILASRAGLARIATASASGAVFCIQQTPGSDMAYGSGPRGASMSAALIASVTARCGSTPWTAVSADQAPRLDCVSHPRNDYLLCRMVQVQIHTTMTESSVS